MGCAPQQIHSQAATCKTTVAGLDQPAEYSNLVAMTGNQHLTNSGLEGQGFTSLAGRSLR